jgi:hypothetical protein
MKSHFRRVTELAIPVHAVCRKKYFPESVLSLVVPAEERLILTLPGIVPEPIETVAVSYSLESSLYTFEAEVAEARVDRDRAVTLLTMYLPDRVARIERRKSPRVLCDQRMRLSYDFVSQAGNPSKARPST